MDWTLFGNIVNILAGLVTIGAPIFSVLRVVVRSKQRSVVPPQTTILQSQGQIQLNKANQVKPDIIPWYVWVKAVLYTLFLMIKDPMIIFLYFIGGVFLYFALFVFCFLVGIPVGWLNEAPLGLRVMLLCVLLIVSLHFSIEFAEHSGRFLQEQLQDLRAKKKSVY